MVLASLVQAAIPLAQSAAGFNQKQAPIAARSAAAKYGPRFAATQAVAAEAFAKGANASRQFKRAAAIAAEYPLTEEEYENLEVENIGGYKRSIRVCIQTIRASRKGFAAMMPSH